jgi:alpha-beta hydrolase superfamily lysophospholipase
MHELVAKGYQVIAPDLRGFGETQTAKGIEQATALM